MKTGKSESGPVPKQFRTFNLHARFTPDGPDGADSSVFLEFSLEAMKRVRELKGKELSHDKARFAKLLAAKRRAEPIVLKMLRDEMPVELAVKKVKRLVRDREMLRELFDVWEKAVRATPEQIAKEKEDIQRRQRGIAHSERLHNDRKAITTGLITLAEATEAGDAEAAKNLAEVVIQASVLLAIAEKRHPELLKPVARKQRMWPVLADDDPGWEREAVRHVAELNLGAESRALKARFRKVRGTDANLPARLWAKAAVRTIEETQSRILSFGQVLRDFGSNQSLADFCLETGWIIGEQPKWVDDAAKLRDFSSDSLPKWKRVIREMIREQMPDFHSQPEWITQRNSAAARGRDTTGEVQNAILDDICSALERIAPAKEVPKSTC